MTLWHNDVLTFCLHQPHPFCMAGPSDQILKVLKLIDWFTMSRPGEDDLFLPPLKTPFDMTDEAEHMLEALTIENQEFQQKFFYYTPRFIGANFYLLSLMHFS